MATDAGLTALLSGSTPGAPGVDGAANGNAPSANDGRDLDPTAPRANSTTNRIGADMSKRGEQG